jgi:hypothetical protein
MKYIIFYLVLVSAIGYGQTNESTAPAVKKNLKYELGLNLYSVTNFHKGDYYDNTNYAYNQNLFSGIFLKRHFEKNSVRVLFDYSQKVVNKKWESTPWFSKTTGDLKSSELRVGYERAFGTKKIIPFLATDLSYNYSKATGLSTVYGDFVSYQDKEYLIKTNQYSICIGSGLKFKITDHIMLTYEFSFQYGYYQSKDYKSNGNASVDKGMFHAFNPVRQVGFSINF